VQIGVQNWLFSNVDEICRPTQKDGFSCSLSNASGEASIIWGVIGPQRIFSHGQLYYGLLLLFLIGGVLPILQWILHKKFKIGLLRYLNFPVIFASLAMMPIASPINYVSWVLVCFLFNCVIRRRHFGWWMKYNYDSHTISRFGCGLHYRFSLNLLHPSTPGQWQDWPQ